MGMDEACVFEFTADDTRPDPFFTMLLSTRRLPDSVHKNRPLEMDETFKVIYEGYPVTLIGQSDCDRMSTLWYTLMSLATSMTRELQI